MFLATRRKAIPMIAGALSGLLLAPSLTGARDSTGDGGRIKGRKPLSKSEWMARWMNAPKAKDIDGDFWMGRFRDEMYFLLKPIAWIPNATQAGSYEAVHVPAGFITDLASIPWPLWSFLRPDGQYAYAAVVHDYLYWTQTRPKDVADDILKFGMEDLKVRKDKIWEIYTAVHLKGQSSWDENALLKSQGERRVLKRYENVANVYWKDWKKGPDVFAPSDEP